MITEMWYDTFSRAYVLEKDPLTPEYRYYKVIRGSEVIPHYVERWDGENEKEHYASGYAICIAYHEDEWNDPVWHSNKFYFMCKDHHFNPIRLIYVVVPPNEFDELVKKFNL